MTALEIILLILGIAAFGLSFILPAGGEKTDAGTRELVEKEAKDAIAREVDGAKEKIDEMVEDTVNYAVEKTERSLEKVSNQKIMAVNEYSETVLEDINKNHKEVLFLYDMLNDKEKNIQSAVSKAEKTVKDIQVQTDTADEEKPEEEFTELKPKKISEAPKAAKPERVAEPDISFTKEEGSEGNHNERILEMHKQGKSNVAIAKELGLGVGEVKLVIDLFEGV